LPGGQAATAAVACARLGLKSRYVGCLGDDVWANTIASSLAAEGVEVCAVRRAGAHSRSASIIVERPTGRRTVIEHRDPRQRLQLEEVDPGVVSSGRVLLVDATDIEAATRAANIARRSGIPTVVDVDRSQPGVDELLAEIDILIVTSSFATSHTQQADPLTGLRQLSSRFRPALSVVTLGAQGSVAVCDGQEIQTAAPAVPVIDTTGAGDAFRGGFIAGWLRFGSDTPVGVLIEYASAVAALNCGGLGAQQALPNQEVVDALVTRAYRRQSK